MDSLFLSGVTLECADLPENQLNNDIFLFFVNVSAVTASPGKTHLARDVIEFIGHMILPSRAQAGNRYPQ